ncbi:MAG: hypothetical protein ACI9IP_002237 [Arcticibacterium sp.]|jgi:hypothetical protein
MKKNLVLVVLLATTNLAFSQKSQKGWTSLFDGKTFSGWHVNEDDPSAFSVEDGTIKVAGKRAHIFYDGAIGNHDFKNFELKIKAKTMPGSNSGIFIHTMYQANGWPSKGYEIQVNQTHTDWRKTGSLYGVEDVKENFAKDNEWYEYHVIVNGKRIIIKIDGKVAVDYTEPDVLPEDRGTKRLSSGTFALQGHDPKSIAYFKDIKVKVLE